VFAKKFAFVMTRVNFKVYFIHFMHKDKGNHKYYADIYSHNYYKTSVQIILHKKSYNSV